MRGQKLWVNDDYLLKIIGKKINMKCRNIWVKVDLFEVFPLYVACGIPV